jgi:hypothetical protein
MNIYGCYFSFDRDKETFAKQWETLKEFWSKHRCHLIPEPLFSMERWNETFWLGNLEAIDSASFYQEMQAIYYGTTRGSSYPDTSYLPDRIAELLLLTPYAIENLDSEAAYKLLISFDNMLNDYQNADDYWGSDACYLYDIKLKEFSYDHL